MRVGLKDNSPAVGAAGLLFAAGFCAGDCPAGRAACSAGGHCVTFIPFKSFLFFQDQGHLDEVLADEPGLQFVGTEDVADD
jgi:hypothetical protein